MHYLDQFKKATFQSIKRFVTVPHVAKFCRSKSTLKATFLKVFLLFNFMLFSMRELSSIMFNFKANNFPVH